jgi:hypothetical protein
LAIQDHVARQSGVKTGAAGADILDNAPWQVK